MFSGAANVTPFVFIASKWDEFIATFFLYYGFVSSSMQPGNHNMIYMDPDRIHRCSDTLQKVAFWEFAVFIRLVSHTPSNSLRNDIVQGLSRPVLFTENSGYPR